MSRAGRPGGATGPGRAARPARAPRRRSRPRAAPRARRTTAAAAASARSLVSATTSATGVAVVLRLADGEHRPVLVLRPEARHRLRQVVRGQDEVDAGHRERLGGVDPVDAGAGAVERHELGVERVRELEVREVLLPAGDPADAADAVRGVADCGPPRRSLVQALGVGAGADPRPGRGRCGGPAGDAAAPVRAVGDLLDGLEDLLVARAAAEVAGESLLDLGAGSGAGPPRAARARP